MNDKMVSAALSPGGAVSKRAGARSHTPVAGLVILSAVLCTGIACSSQASVSMEQYRHVVLEGAQVESEVLTAVGAACKNSSGLFASSECLASLDDAIAAQKKFERRLASMSADGQFLKVRDGLRGAVLCMAAAMHLVRSGMGKNLDYYKTGTDLVGTCHQEYQAVIMLVPGMGKAASEASATGAGQ